jgi:hypothetical protein
MRVLPYLVFTVRFSLTLKEEQDASGDLLEAEVSRCDYRKC